MSLNSEQIKKMGWNLIGQVGVNSGFVLIGDPHEVLEKKSSMKLINIKDNIKKFNNSLVVPSGWGDGNYHVYVQQDNDGRTLRLLIDFTTTFGFDNKNPELHDIDIQTLFKECIQYQQEKSKIESL